MWRLLLSVLLLATTVLGQDEPIQLYGFRGLNTIAGDFQLKPIDARKAHNIDFGRQIGTLMPRRGYDSISAMPLADSIVGIYGAYYSDGSQQLFSVIDRTFTVDTTFSTDTTEFGNSAGKDALVYDLGPGILELGHLHLDYRDSLNADLPVCLLTNLWLLCKGNDGKSGCKVKFAVRDASSDTVDNWTVEYESDYFVLDSAGAEIWRGVEPNVILTAGKKALGVIGYDGEGNSGAAGAVQHPSNRYCYVYNDITGEFDDPIGETPTAATYGIWCLYGEYVTFSVETTFYDYGTVFATAKGSADISASTNLWEYFSVQNKPSFAMLDDNIYIVNGSHKGIVYDGNNARPYPLQAPGEPLIVPLSASGDLNGEYRYAFQGWIRTDLDSSDWLRLGVISSPITVNNGQVLLTRFQMCIPDSILIGDIDTIQMVVYRTKGDVGALDLNDTLYFTGEDFWWAPGSMSSLTHIDSIHDTLIDDNASKTVAEMLGRVGRDSTGSVDQGRRYGAPSFVSSDATYPNGDTLLDIFEGWPTIQTDTLGVAYTCTFIDTATGIESDTGRSLFVFCDSGNPSPSYRQVTINLPKTIDTEEGIVINLYRGCIYQQGYDTSYYGLPFESYEGAVHEKFKDWIYNWVPETVLVLDYYLIGQFTSDDTLFTDSISYDSLSRCRRYSKTTAPPLMNKIFSYENRLFGIQKSGLYYSASVYADTLQSWGAMALTPINPDDGDMVTTAWPARGVIRVMKSYSNVNVYQDANLNWNKTEISGYFGCIAGRSHVAGIGGHYYLSSEGIIKEVEGLALERTQQSSLLSPTLNNFDLYTVNDLSEAEGFYFDRKYLLSLGDTTYVYDERAEAWSTWGFTFAGATLYGTEDEIRFLPGDSMYFIKPGDVTLYRFGGSDSDMTTPIEMVWKSGPFLAGPEEKRIYRIGRWISSTDAADSMGLNVFDEEGDSLGSITFSSLTSRYLEKGFGLGPGNLFQVEITSSSPGTAIEKLDVWYKVLARKITQ